MNKDGQFYLAIFIFFIITKWNCVYIFINSDVDNYVQYLNFDKYK